jgi:putative transposase
MIEPAHDLAISKQAKALNISRGSVYYLPRPMPEAELALMRRLDRLHLEFPFAFARDDASLSLSCQPSWVA